MEGMKCVMMKVSGDDYKIQMEWSLLVNNVEEWIRHKLKEEGVNELNGEEGNELNGEEMKMEEVSLIGSA